MPAGNGRGPMGAGPMTGRGAGYCAGYSEPGFVNPVRGGGYFGYGRGGGRGWRNQRYAAGTDFRGRGFRNFQMAGDGEFNYLRPEFSAESELRMLKEQAELMQKELASVNERINELGILSTGKRDDS